MAEIILAILCFVAGVIASLGAALAFFGNAMGAATNASEVNNWPTLWLALVALAAFGSGISILVL